MPCSQWFLGSVLPSAPATGCAKNTLPRHEMSLPCELLPQGPRGAAAPGPCSFRVPVHPGRAWELVVLVAHTSAKAVPCGGSQGSPQVAVACPCGCLRTPLLPPAEPQRCDQRALRHRPQAGDAAGAGCPPHLHHCLSHPPQPEGLPQERGVSPPPCPQASICCPFSVSLCPCVTATFWGVRNEML